MRAKELRKEQVGLDLLTSWGGEGDFRCSSPTPPPRFIARLSSKKKAVQFGGGGGVISGSVKDREAGGPSVEAVQ